MKTTTLKFTMLVALCYLIYSCSKKDSPSPTPQPQPTIPAIPSGLAMVSKTTSSITLKWNTSTGATGYRLYQGTKKVYEGDKSEFIDNGLTANTNYTYSISAYNTVGESSKSSELIIKTDELKPVIPAVTTGLSLIAKTMTSISLKWDSTATATGYRLYRANAKVYEGNRRAYIDSNLTANTTYEYAVTSFNTAGESDKSPILSVKTDEPKPTVPSTPTGLTFVSKTTNSISLKWNNSTNATAYRLYRGNTKVFEGNKLEFTDSNLTPNTSYNYTISAVNAIGESPKSAIVAIKTDEPKLAAPPTPTGLSLISKTTNSIYLKWSASSTATGYRIYRSNNKVYEGEKLEFNDSGLMENTSYDYTVSAFNTAGESIKSSVLTVKTNPAPITVNVHLNLGNPTNAANDANNYLITKPQYALSYNNTLRHANWVSWELSKSWLGSAERQDDFRPDATLPNGWYRVVPGDYTNSGFDRGHLCPSADRTKTVEDNSSTFLMTNIIPQAPELNRESWAYLEEYCRSIVKSGYKASIIAGTIGTGGVGSNGAAKTVKNNVNVPARIYKIIVLYSEFGSVNSASRVIAVNFPNTNADNNEISWLKHVTTVADIEKQSGASFFSSLPAVTQNALKSQKYDAANSPFDVDAPVRSYNGNPLYIGPRGGCYYVNSNGNKTYVDRSYCGTN